VIRFDYPYFLWLLLLIPFWIGGLWWSLRQRKRASELFAGRTLLDRIAYSMSFTRMRVKAVFWLFAWILIVLGAAAPQIGTRMEDVKREGIDVMLAIDVSNSMLATDIQPSRLESAKQEIQKFIGGLKGDRIGIVAFAGSAIVHCPLTTDYGAVKLLTRILQPDLVPEQGTALADAIDAARKSYTSQEVKSRVMVIITDGEDHEESAVDAAKQAAKDGIHVYAIGMGTPQGAPIPVKDDKGRDLGLKRDASGQVIVSRLNDVLLERIADAGCGKFVRATSSGRELDALWSDFNAMEKTQFGKKQFAGWEDRFYYFVFPALLLIAIEFLISERKGKIWIGKLWQRFWSDRLKNA
jgi:Ca-activated chloride channel homolog